MDFLKNILGEKYEDFKAAIDKYNTENKDKAIKLADLSTGEYISKAKYDSLELEKKSIEEQLKTANETLTTLQKENKDNEALIKRIEELEQKNKDAAASYKKELDNLKIGNAIDRALSEARAKTPRAVKAMLDMEGIKLDKDGTVTGISEQLKKLTEAEDTKYLFEGEQQFRGAQVGNSDPTPDGEDTSKMTYSEMCAYFEKNPNAKL